MNDFDYEVRQKKLLARNAIHKKGGSKSKKCSLPSDHMTHAEWKRRNGKVEGYSLNKPLTYKEWTAMPDDIQREYWTKLRERFGNIANSRIRRDMLLTSEPTLNKELERLGLPRHPVVDGVIKNSIHSSDADLAEWEKWLGRIIQEKPKQDITAMAMEHMEERKERKKANRCAVNNISTQLYGTNESLYTELKGLLSYLPEGNYVVEVQIKRTGKYHEQE